MDAWAIVAERRIREAMEAGDFDNLEAAGRPLSLQEDASEDSQARVAHRLLRNQGFSLPWIEELKELRVAREELRQRIASYLQQNEKAAWQQGVSCTDVAQRERIVNRLRENIDTVNRRIATYNLKTPSVRFHIPLLDPPRGLRNAK